MQRYSVLLVDDEEDVIRVIMKKINWENLGFRVSGYAHNGVEALEMAEECAPDVVLTDIKMPYMDGLSMSRRLKEQYPNIKIIIFSGFDEFEYAKEAIDIEVEQYLLKPVNAAELERVFSRIQKELDRERDEQQNIDKLNQYYLESLPLLQESFYTSLIEGRMQPEEIERYKESYQIRLEAPFYVVTVLHISRSQLPDGLSPFLMAVSVKKLAEEQLKERYGSKILMYLGEVVVISQLPDAAEITSYTDMMNTFCIHARKICEAKVTAGIGQVCGRLSDMHASYQGAENAVSYRAIYGNTRAIHISEIDPGGSPELSFEQDAIQNLLREIRMGDRDTLARQIDVCRRWLTGPGSSIQKYRVFILELAAELFRFGNNNQIPVERIFGSAEELIESGFQAESPEEFWDWLLLACERAQEYIRQERANTTKSFVTKAIHYVQSSYGDKNISIETVCRTLGVSSAYFSTVFKKETGKTFIGYLTDLRMEQAVELLLTTDDKTYMIAEKVGYSDPNYFSYAFKKQYGVSPSKYRVEKLKERG